MKREGGRSETKGFLEECCSQVRDCQPHIPPSADLRQACSGLLVGRAASSVAEQARGSRHGQDAHEYVMRFSFITGSTSAQVAVMKGSHGMRYCS